MGFPKSVRNRVLIESARHCCVCHRYKGVKVEVHHIQPEAAGGKSAYENAIALCFDCHADAGHYNPMHSRGTKFTPDELRKAKENWLKMVERNNIQQPKESDQLYCRYYLCKNYEHLVEIAKGDLARFPVENPLLVKNEVIRSLTKIIENHPVSFRDASAWGKALSSIEEYLVLNPKSVTPNASDGRFSYFDVIRTPSREELEELAPKDGLLRIMLETDLPVEQIAMVGGYRDGCGGVALQEEYILRKLWCSFLAITNISNRPVALDSIVGQKLIGSGFQALTVSSTDAGNISLPKAPVPPKATVLLPLAVILPPFYPVNSEIWSQTHDHHGHVQMICHEGIRSISPDDYLIYETQVIAKSIRYRLDGNIAEQNLHDLDLSNMYTIDRSWECGSCPHLFYVGERVSYFGEVLAQCSSRIGIDSFVIPNGINTAIIAEIEDEVTEIISLSIDEDTFLENVSLKKDQFIEIPVSSCTKITIVGRYVPDMTIKNNVPRGAKRNELVSKFLTLRNNERASVGRSLIIGRNYDNRVF